MSSSLRRWLICLRWLLVVAIAAVAADPAQVTVAQNITRFGEHAETLPGIVQAVSRHYSSMEGTALVFVFGFDAEANAQAALETLDAKYESNFAEYAVDVGALGTETRAYSRDHFPFDTWTEILTADGPYVYVVSVLTNVPELDSVDLATRLIEAVITTAAGEGLGEFYSDGSSTGGLWDKLPDDAMGAVFSIDWDDQIYPQRYDPADGGVDVGALAGIQRVVQRNYSGDAAALATPETAPSATYFLVAEIAAFDMAGNAAAALEPISTQVLSGYGEGFSITPESADPGELGDQVVAHVGATEKDGLSIELATIVVQANASIYTVAAVGVGTDTGVLETATAIIEAMIATEAGSGDGTFDETGHSTGGIWDQLPGEGDAVLNDLLPESDEQIYP
jgi:hypothetical protein